MSTPLFTGAPTSKYLLLGLTASSLLATALDAHPSLHPTTTSRITTHNASYTTLLIHQTCYANPVSLFFACVLLYHLRVVERLWGSRKFIHFLAYALLPCCLLPLALTALPVSGLATALPPATLPTSLLYALLANYHTLVPHSWQYASSFPLLPALDSQNGDSRPSDASEGSSDENGDWSVKASSKWQTYVLAAQLVVGGGSGVGGLMAAAVGWGVGKAWGIWGLGFLGV